MDLIVKKSTNHSIRLGFIPLNDAAPFLLAQELDLFRDHGLEVRLSRELGWGSIRDKVATGELDAAQSIIGLPLSVHSPQSSATHPYFLAPLVTSIQGNAITIAKHFREEGCQTPRSILRWRKENKESRPLTFAIVSRFSSHHILMRQWLKSDGINPDKDVNLVVLPPPQMVHHLKAGHIDGYCVGEPWNSVGIMAGCGFCAATSVEISPYHPEKILMVSSEFASANEERYFKLVAAVLEACRLCNEANYLEKVSRVLARYDYLNLSPDILQDTLTGSILRRNNATLDASHEFVMFSGEGVNAPCDRHRNWIGQNLHEAGLFDSPLASNQNLLRNIFSEQHYKTACGFLNNTAEVSSQSNTVLCP